MGDGNSPMLSSMILRISWRPVQNIAKFHAPEYPGLPQCEFATMIWAKESGVETPNFELRSIADFDSVPDEMPTGDGTVFVIERFDRRDEKRIHMEDFGQILDRPPGDPQYHGTYEEIASVIRWIAPESSSQDTIPRNF